MRKEKYAIKALCTALCAALCLSGCIAASPGPGEATDPPATPAPVATPSPEPTPAPTPAPRPSHTDLPVELEGTVETMETVLFQGDFSALGGPCFSLYYDQERYQAQAGEEEHTYEIRFSDELALTLSFVKDGDAQEIMREWTLAAQDVRDEGAQPLGAYDAASFSMVKEDTRVIAYLVAVQGGTVCVALRAGTGLSTGYWEGAIPRMMTFADTIELYDIT